MTSISPSAPPSQVQEPVVGLPPTYDEAVQNIAPEQIHLDTSNLPHSTPIAPQDDLNKIKKEEEEEKRKQELYNAGPPIVTQPQPGYTYPPPNSQPGTTYNFPPPNPQQQQPSNESIICCTMCYPEDIADICYCIFCCSRLASGNDCVCCDCGNHCCSCSDGFCECGDCDCGGGGGDGDCDCCAGDGDCDCGGCDCDCGDCTII